MINLLVRPQVYHFPYTWEQPIHLGAKGSISYHTPFLDFKDAAGKNALIDYNYASLTITDDNWQGFGGDMEVDIDFPEPQMISEVQLTNLRFTISGVYVPESHQVLGLKMVSSISLWANPNR